MNMEMSIDLEGRKLTETKVDEMTADKITTTNTYDDGTVIQFIQNAGNINVKCNKGLVVQADGKTVKIEG